MERKGEPKKVKYRCRYCQKEYMSRDEFIQHKKSKHGEEMNPETSLSRPSRDGKKRSEPSTSLPQGQVTPGQLSSASLSAPGIPSASPSGSPSKDSVAQNGRKDKEKVQSEKQEPGARPSAEPSEGASPVQKRSRKSPVEESNIEKPKAVDKHRKTRLQSKAEARAGLRPRRDGGRLGTAQTTRKNMPMPYGQKVRTVGLDGKEKEEWLRNPKMKGA